MFRLFTLALLAASAALAAPVPKGDKKEELYFPTTVGSKKVMQRNAGTARAAAEYTQTVTKVDTKDGTYTVTVEQDMGGGQAGPVIVYEVSAKGVFLASAGGRATDQSVPMLKLPAKEGDTWEVDRPKGTYTVGKEEVVEVPAGKYKAIRLEVVRELAMGQTQKTTLWHAPGVGIIRQVISTGGTDSVTELKEFTPGKEEKKADDKKKDEPKKDK